MERFKYDNNSGLYIHSHKPPVDYVDGSEDYLLEIFKGQEKIKSCSPELIKFIRDWPSRYHLSFRRINLLESVKEIFDGITSVLEIGSGCGALTRWLGENFSAVDTIEGSRLRAVITRERTRDLKNVNVFNGDISEISFNPDKYELITVVGVMEYIPYYSKSEDPKKPCIKFLKGLSNSLVDEGVLLLAIENKFGAKYFTGCAEEHTGRLFEGLSGYPDKTPVTFSRGELESILAHSGFKNIQFYHLFPDYKLLETILIESKEVLSLYPYNWVKMPSQEYAGSRLFMMHEPLFLKNITESGLLWQFSNSFLVLASKSKDREVRTEWLIKKFFNSEKHSNMFHHTVTLIRNTTDNYIIKREPLYSSSIRVELENVTFNLSERDNFVQGEILLYDAYKCLSADDTLGEISQLAKKLDASLLKYFSINEKDEEGYHLVDGGAIDYTFWNLIKGPDNSLHYMDRKWRFRDKIPADFVLFRSLYYLYAIYAPFIKEKDSRSFIVGIINTIYPKYTGERLKENLKLEESFQSEVSNNPENFNALELPPPAYSITDWIKSIKDKDELILTQNSQIQEVSSWAKSLDHKIQERDTLILSQNSKIEEVSSWAKSLDREITEKDIIITNLNHQATEKDSVINNLNHQVTEKDSVINNLNHQVTERNNTLNQIYSSDLWKIATKFKTIAKKTWLPYYAIKALLIVKRYGFKEFIRRINRKIGTFINDTLKSRNIEWPAVQGSQITKDKLLETVTDNISKSNDIELSIAQDSQINENKSYDYKELLKKLKLTPSNAASYDIIFFSIINWAFRYQRPQHIAVGFAETGHRVFYISIDLKNQTQYGIQALSENIYEITLPFVNDSAIYNTDLNEGIKTSNKAIGSLIRDYGIKDAVAFVQYPLWAPLVKDLKDRYGTKVIFDYLDEFSGFSNVNADYVNKFDSMMVDLSDICICTSQNILEKIKTKTNRVQLIPNATEFEYFNELPINDLLKDIDKPIIGYYGAIAEWFDTDTVEFVAKSRPDWNIVLIGHTFFSDVERLKKYNNIHLLGEKPYKELTKYLYWFDVCLIPFKLCDLILSTNPVKFYEYISSGKPVVSSNLPELQQYKGIMYFANNKEEFLEKIGLALKEDDEKVKKTRIEIAQCNDWNHRVNEIKRSIVNLSPKVSIIIVTHNNKEYTKLCINSITEKTAYPNYEIIVVDNASSDGTKDYLEELGDGQKIKAIINDNNLGFAKANNIGIRNAGGEYIILLNNDTVVTRGWVSGVIRHLKDPLVGMVGPVTNNIGNEARINVEYTDIDHMDSFAEKYTGAHFGESFEIKNLAMFCGAFKKDIVEDVGLLDEQFEVGMFEDDDYALRIKNAGYKLLCAEDVFIHHFGNVSFNKLEEQKRVIIFEKNREKYEKKWGVEWEAHKYRDGVSGIPPTITHNFIPKTMKEQGNAVLEEGKNLFPTAHFYFPPGHFYSPIPSMDEVRLNEEKIFNVARQISGIDLFERDQLELIKQFVPYYDQLIFTPVKTAGIRYHYDNPNYSYTDAIFLHCMIRHLNPKKIIEIGSGYSSCVMLDTNEFYLDNKISCTFIEPYPELLLSLLKEDDHDRSEIIQSKPQDIEIEKFSSLSEGDILFIDSTHVSKVGSDVNYIFFEILPFLKKGVYIHFHDIFYPFEYPKKLIYKGLAWNEDYILRAFLEYNNSYKVVLFSDFIATFYRDILEQYMPLCLKNTGCNIWLRKVS